MNGEYKEGRGAYYLREGLREESERLRKELRLLDAKVRRMSKALADIADTDYRGNRSSEAQRAQLQLEIEGIRPASGA